MQIDLIYQNIKYKLIVFQSGPDNFWIKKANDDTIVFVDVRSLADGGYLVLIDGKKYVVDAREEPTGLRLVLDGHTCVFTHEYDPTRLVAPMSGKLVRYLVLDGQHVLQNQPFAEVEVMKMYMPLLAAEAGVLHTLKPEGSVLEAGDLIATVVLDDPSKVFLGGDFN